LEKIRGSSGGFRTRRERIVPNLAGEGGVRIRRGKLDVCRGKSSFLFAVGRVSWRWHADTRRGGGKIYLTTTNYVKNGFTEGTGLHKLGVELGLRRRRKECRAGASHASEQSPAWAAAGMAGIRAVTAFYGSSRGEGDHRHGGSDEKQHPYGRSKAGPGPTKKTRRTKGVECPRPAFWAVRKRPHVIRRVPCKKQTKKTPIPTGRGGLQRTIDANNSVLKTETVPRQSHPLKKKKERGKTSKRS